MAGYGMNGNGVPTTAEARIESREQVELIPLRSAYLCVECERITRTPKGKCLGCGSGSVLSVSQMIEGRAVQATA